MKNCGYRFHILVTTREFVEGVLVRAIIPRNNPPLVVHDRVLSIVQVQEALVDGQVFDVRGESAVPEAVCCVLVSAAGVGGRIPQLSRPHRCGVCV